jgi:FMN reductase
MSSRRIAVVSAGLRAPSSTRLLADHLSAATTRALESAGHQWTVTHVELRDLGHEIVDALTTGLPVGALRRVIDTVSRADAVIAVTPTHSGSYSGLFKSFVDAIEPGALRGTPVLLAATGGSDRHSLMLDHTMRPLFAAIGAAPVPTGVYAAGPDLRGPRAAALAGRVERAAHELVRALPGVERVELPHPVAG